MNQMNQAVRGEAKAQDDRSIRDRVEQAIELASNIKALSQSLNDACFGTAPGASLASGCDLDLSSSLSYVTATLSDVRVNLQRVLTSIEGNKPAAMVRAG